MQSALFKYGILYEKIVQLKKTVDKMSPQLLTETKFRGTDDLEDILNLINEIIACASDVSMEVTGEEE